MYLHLGQSTLVKTKDIIGIFDLDTATVAKPTRDFLSKAEKMCENATFALELLESKGSMEWLMEK